MPWEIQERESFAFMPADVKKLCLATSLRLQAVLHAAAASAERDVGSGENGLGLAVLANLSQSVDKTTDESNKDGGTAAEGDRRVEEDQTAERNG